MCQTLQNATQNTALPNSQLGLLWWAYLLCRRSLKLQTQVIFRMILPNNTSSFRHRLRRWEGLRPRSHLQPQAPGGHLWRHSSIESSLPLLWFPGPRGFLIHGRQISSSEEARKEKKIQEETKKERHFLSLLRTKDFSSFRTSPWWHRSAWIYTCFVRLLSEMSVARRRTVSTKMTDFRFWETMWRHTKSREIITQELMLCDASGAEFGLMQRRGPGVKLVQNAWTVAK